MLIKQSLTTQDEKNQLGPTLSLARRPSPNACMGNSDKPGQRTTEGSGYVPYPDLGATGTFVALLNGDKGEEASLQVGLPLEAFRGTIKRVRKSGDPGTRDNPIALDGPETGFPSKAARNETRRLRRIQGLIDQATRQRVGKSYKGKQQQQETPTCSQECMACGHTQRLQDFTTLAKCSHGPVLCVQCFTSWIAAQVEESKDKIRCPEAGCKTTLEHAEVKQYASPATFDQYDTYATLSVLARDPKFRWCLEPDCRSGQIHEGGLEQNIFTCTVCGFCVCVFHEREWHEGETCDDFDRRVKQKEEQRVQEAASAEAISELTKKCPGDGCGWKIEKNGGCDHMTCTRCGYEFCWLCLAPYDSIRRDGNLAHRSGCKYHSSRV